MCFVRRARTHNVAPLLWCSRSVTLVSLAVLFYVRQDKPILTVVALAGLRCPLPRTCRMMCAFHLRPVTFSFKVNPFISADVRPRTRLDSNSNSTYYVAVLCHCYCGAARSPSDELEIVKLISTFCHDVSGCEPYSAILRCFYRTTFRCSNDNFSRYC